MFDSPDESLQNPLPVWWRWRSVQRQATGLRQNWEWNRPQEVLLPQTLYFLPLLHLNITPCTYVSFRSEEVSNSNSVFQLSILNLQVWLRSAHWVALPRGVCYRLFCIEPKILSRFVWRISPLKTLFICITNTFILQHDNKQTNKQIWRLLSLEAIVLAFPVSLILFN